MRTTLPLIALGLALAGCPEDEIYRVPQAQVQVDVFDQKTAAEVDVLWVVDNSQSMAPIQNRIASRFVDFFNQLQGSKVDYHIGVVTTDADGEVGKLRAYTGRAVSNCAGNCYYISRDVGCDDPASPETCDARMVFENLIHVGIEGANYERGLLSASKALGLHVDGEGTFQDAPAENASFLRENADLHIIFVSDEDDNSHGSDAWWASRYYTRLFERLKGAGNENKVTISAIVGDPKRPAGLEPGSVCAAWRSDPEGNEIDFRIGPENSALGCRDTSDPGNPSVARVGSKYLEVACASGGVFASICDGNYSTTLDRLGANAAGLRRFYRLTRRDEIELGCDKALDTGDDRSVACGAMTAEQYGFGICVEAVDINNEAAGPVVVPYDPQEGWSYEEATAGIRFNGRFVPAPGTSVSISYNLIGGIRNCGN